MSQLIARFKMGLRSGRALYRNNASSIFTTAKNVLGKVRSIDEWARSLAPENQAIQSIIQSPIYNEILAGVDFANAKLKDVEAGLKEVDRLAGDAERIIDQVEPIVQIISKGNGTEPLGERKPMTPPTNEHVKVPMSEEIKVSRDGERIVKPLMRPKPRNPRQAKPTPTPQRSLIGDLQTYQAARDKILIEAVQRIIPTSVPLIQGAYGLANSFGLK